MRTGQGWADSSSCLHPCRVLFERVDVSVDVLPTLLLKDDFLLTMTFLKVSSFFSSFLFGSILLENR